jgi:hypothetical protein
MQSTHNKIFQDVPNEIDETWRHGAILGGMAEGAYDHLAVADAYKLAGDTLVKQALSNSEAYELIYPIMFNYRHCLELYLKIIIKPTKRTHGLQSLVQELNEYTKVRYSTELPQWFKGRILDFDEFEPGATAFRYDDVGIASKNTGDIGEFWIDLHHLKTIMNVIQKCFHRLIRDSEGNTTIHVQPSL